MKCFTQTIRCWFHSWRATSIAVLVTSARRARRLSFRLFLAGCAAILFTALRRSGQTRRSCLFFCFLLVSVPYFSEQATNGYADVVVSFYFGAGSLYLYLWQTTRRRLFLVLSALVTGGAALTKNEGLVVIGIHLVWLGAALLSDSRVGFKSRLRSIWSLHLHSGHPPDAVVSFQGFTRASERCHQRRSSRRRSQLEQLEPSWSNPVSLSDTGVRSEELESGLDSIVRGCSLAQPGFVVSTGCVRLVRDGFDGGCLYECLSYYALLRSTV